MTPDAQFMRLALRLARRGCGRTSPNPMVGAVLVKDGRILGRGWHRQAGLPHAEIEALDDAEKHGRSPRGATLYVTLEPCCTHGRTPPCTDAIIAAGVRRVIAGATDPNPKHSGRAFAILRRAGIEAGCIADLDARPGRAAGRGRMIRQPGHLLAAECRRLNEAFNHWIVRRTPWVTVKAAMTLDGKIATAMGESKWITGPLARAHGMKLRQAADAVLVGVNTVLKDDPSLTLRPPRGSRENSRHATSKLQPRSVRRIVLDSMARTPLDARVASDKFAKLTTIVASKRAPKKRVAALGRRVSVLLAPSHNSKVDLRWLLKKLGAEGVTNLLVEGGGEVNASFLLGGLAHRVAFFYAPKILGGRESHKAVAGEGAARLEDVLELRDLEWRKLGPDLLLAARLR
jgi:diaminohydroxyphosphoribosylaminopyrimidine deaminase/5-amino-6-(5-phosphoribosylamino)uracil reductase